ncbi:hypothetical protein BSIN_4143 [Burkholderia singularis]|uniref:Spondin domain-containing protein n=1 Tax=Burkholderia singularis TaxID=1503053 RepID=A0A238H6P1_9BURK|nr:hypothetical protein BSIN_4143 [Burkholderia singularis]
MANASLVRRAGGASRVQRIVESPDWRGGFARCRIERQSSNWKTAGG